MRRRCSLVLISILLLLVGGLVVDAPMGSDGDQLTSDMALTPRLPPPSQHQKLVFAHYFPPYPISIDNRDPVADYYATEYLNPNGESGIHAVYGGLLRDRPLPRARRPGDDWREQDMAEEIRQASSAGIDGFSVDILTTHDNPLWISPIPSLLLRTAEKTNPQFKIMLMPDMSGELKTLTPEQLASEMSLLASSPAAFRLADGRLVVSPYIAENLPESWWQEFISSMKEAHKIDVALVPVFLDSTSDVINEFAPISFGMSNWGPRNPAANPVDGFPIDTIREVHGRSKIWMQPVSVQDYRPRDQIYDEAENTTNLRNTWKITINGDADWVQIVTWNDYSENTAIAPSVRHGTALLDIFSYYISYFKRGAPPPITEERVFLSHRTQLIGATPNGRQTRLASLRIGSAPGRDAVEALTFLREPALVTLTVGSSKTYCDASAGVSTCPAPISEPGPNGSTVKVAVTRGHRHVVSLTSPFTIVANPPGQDLSYVVSGARASYNVRPTAAQRPLATRPTKEFRCLR
jgi:Glycosyl hydrolase family 71